MIDLTRLMSAHGERAKQIPARSLSSGRGVNGVPLAPKKGPGAIGDDPRTPGNLQQAIRAGKVLATRDGFVVRWVGSRFTNLRRFDRGTSRQPRRPVIGLHEAHRRQLLAEAVAEAVRQGNAQLGRA